MAANQVLVRWCAYKNAATNEVRSMIHAHSEPVNGFEYVIELSPRGVENLALIHENDIAGCAIQTVWLSISSFMIHLNNAYQMPALIFHDNVDNRTAIQVFESFTTQVSELLSQWVASSVEHDEVVECERDISMFIQIGLDRYIPNLGHLHRQLQEHLYNCSPKKRRRTDEFDFTGWPAAKQTRIR